ncbi:hypothetical protein [Streptomyces sp. TRM 70361]|uniref:hypothetical protein n=1 Tax=Streptomyces sp. TRM 70361 TaxID=3116553 RepID=UPI003FCE5AC8
MRTTGTIDHPATHGPALRPLRKTETTMTLHNENHASIRPDATAVPRQNRNRDMQLIPEAMARVHIQERMREARTEQLSHRVVIARRMQRRAERASLRARRALAMAVMQ